MMKPWADLLLVHFSRASLGRLCKGPRLKPGPKPCGLWVSVENHENSWSDWCESERFHLECLAFAHEIVLHDNSDILMLRSAEEVDAFTKRFLDMSSGAPRILESGYIDWREVARRHQGIIIAPYIWERRLHDGSFWYYGWDCASGCIWDVDAISRVEPIERPIRASETAEQSS